MYSRIFPALAALSFLASTLQAQTTSGLHEACEKEDVERVRLLLNEADPNAVNARGETPLMLAAKTGNFELCRALIWAGAKANTADKKGKKVREYLNPKEAGITPVNLLLRCYAYVQAHSKQAETKPARPEMVIVSDSFIDYDHRDLKARYWVNAAEAKGKAGVDDDGNGFVDDVYGWNASADEPLRVPLLANVADNIQSKLLSRFVTLYNRTKVPDYREGEWKGETLADLDGSFENPLVRQLGFDVLDSGGIAIDDRTFTKMFTSSSHGTHVAGIVLKHSDGKALLHGMMHGRFQMSKEAVAHLTSLAQELAPRTISYEQFVLKLRQTLLDEALEQGLRRSAYLRTAGAGVMNMSWGQSKSWFLNTAMQLQEIYRMQGMDADSIDRYTCPVGLDLCGDLGFELLVNAAAELALLFHENPNVLFVLSAGNSTEDNDVELSSPAYLSRFFPNVITVASADAENALSSFSNYGLASVQVAAPGENILSTLLSNQEGYMSGTSMAAPAVAGLAAKLRAEHPNLTAADIRLVLERSVRPEKNLRLKISSGGMVDAEAASALATKWTPGSRADLTLAALTVPTKPEEADVLIKEESDEAEEHRAREISTGTRDRNGARLTALGGFADQWRVAMTTGTAFQSQAIHPMGKLPIDWIRPRWEKGWEISSIGGEHDNWRVVMSHTGKAGRAQKLLGLDFDTTSLDDLLSLGWRITSHAGFAKSWVFVLTADTGWQEQLYPLPGPFDAARKKWLTEKLAEGYRITSLAGDDYEQDRSQDCWSLILTRGTAVGNQVFTGPTAWPTEWIAEHEKKGFQISHFCGFGDHWVVVMMQGGADTKTLVNSDTKWDDAWVQQKWKQP